MSDLTATIQRVLDLDREATAKPWRWDPKRGTYESDNQNVGGFVAGGAAVCHFGNAERYYPSEGEPPNEADRDLIAEYRTAAPDLARALVAEQGRVADLERQLAASRKAGEEMRAMYMRKAAVVDGLDAQLAEANARADEWEDKARADKTRLSNLLWRDLYRELGDLNFQHMKERDAARADLQAAESGRVAALDIAKGAYEERDEARAALAAANSRADLAYEEKALADREFTAIDKLLAAARQDAEALRAQVATLTVERDDAMARAERFAKYVDAVAPLSAPPAPAPARQDAEALRAQVAAMVKKLRWCRHTISNANDIILRDGGDEDDAEEVNEELVEIDALLALSAPPAPVAAPDLAALLKDARSVMRHRTGHDALNCPHGDCDLCESARKIDTVLAEHNRQRLAGVK